MYVLDLLHDGPCYMINHCYKSLYLVFILLQYLQITVFLSFCRENLPANTTSRHIDDLYKFLIDKYSGNRI